VDYDAALAALDRRGPGRMVPDLDRITRLASMLGDPQLAYPSIQVTGTNGKTSITRMIATLLSAAGVSAGTYTSPHLQSVRERFTVAGRWIGEQALAEVVKQVDPIAGLVDHETVVAGGDAELDRVTYFEMLTACAYWWFADKPVDVGVFEVGMGGTWDATNLVRGEVAVLGPVDVDHSELGDTAADVAGEKSGIIKPGAHVVTSAQSADVMKVIRARVEEVGATLWAAGTDVEVVDRRVAVGGQYLTLRVGDRTIDDVMLPLFGAHQADNAAVALGAVAAFLGDAFHNLSDDLVRQGFQAVTVPGRLELVHRDPTVILDGAHNPHGAQTAAAAVADSFDFRSLVLVVGCLADKNVDGIVRAWADVANHVVVTRAPSSRGAPLERMQQAAVDVWEGSGVVVESTEDVLDAIQMATGVAGEGDGVLVTGSLYTVGAARDRYLPVLDTGDEIAPDPDDLSEEEEEREFQRALDEMIDRLDDEEG
jgi:dihydrofolate synthase/folylpolyglutamate synthase